MARWVSELAMSAEKGSEGEGFVKTLQTRGLGPHHHSLTWADVYKGHANDPLANIRDPLANIRDTEAGPLEGPRLGFPPSSILFCLQSLPPSPKPAWPRFPRLSYANLMLFPDQ